MNESILEEIRGLKRSRGAVILAHNYQRPEVQDAADFTGDSLELARKATTVDAETIVFCGVHFMAETAAVLNPGRRVLLPDPKAGCPMADMVTAEQVRTLKAAHPGAKVVCYVNSSAEVKAESDSCCTSSNAVEVVRRFAGEDVIFVPDRHLGSFVEEKLGRKLILWEGFCPTHQRLTPEDLAVAKAKHPGATVVCHPECARPIRELCDAVLSTGQMCAYAKESPAREFLVATEEGLLHRLMQENPGKRFYLASSRLLCPNMKRITLEKVRDALRDGAPVVTVPDDVASRARRAIEAMLAG
jgi:quinolinate synthase